VPLPTSLGVASGDHKDLRAYRLARNLGRELWDASIQWPSFERWSFGIQLIRAADSVGANIAEATGRWHRPDQMRLLYIARGSVHELEHWIDVAKERDLLSAKAGQAWPELARTLNGLIRSRRA
jgi:four helix bundle protein